MTRIHKSIAIDAAPAEVMDVITDPRRLAEYAVGVSQVDDIQQTDATVGTTFRATYHTMGIPFHLRFHIAEYEPASRALARVEGGMTGTFDWRVTPNGTGSELSLDIDYDMPGGAIGRAVNRIMLERMNDKNAERMLENIKMLSEAEPEPQPA